MYKHNREECDETDDSDGMCSLQFVQLDDTPIYFSEQQAAEQEDTESHEAGVIGCDQDMFRKQNPHKTHKQIDDDEHGRISWLDSHHLFSSLLLRIRQMPS